MSEKYSGTLSQETDFSKNKKQISVGITEALSELWVFQEKVDMKVSAFSFNSSLLIFGYL